MCPSCLVLPKKIKEDIDKITDEFLAFKRATQPNTPSSVLNSLDFHWSLDTLKIIESNTNASGYLITHLLLHLLLKEPQAKGHPQPEKQIQKTILDYESRLHQSFLRVFASKKPEPLFIIDEDPKKEKMHPEFLMFKDFFLRQGLKSVDIIKTKDLPLSKPAFVYNRETDFYLKKHPNLLKAYRSGLIKLSTSPRAYKILASKRSQDLKHKDIHKFPNLQKALLNSSPLPPPQDSLRERFWERRKKFFFKPQESFGGKGVYAGKSISRKKFESLNSDFMAQEAHPPGRIKLKGPGGDSEEAEWKYDIRAFFSESQVQKTVARVYQGQVTNFSKAGGGFALIEWT